LTGSFRHGGSQRTRRQSGDRLAIERTQLTLMFAVS